jgi:hypothetical protein
MKRKKGLPGFTQTEPELLIGAMERHADWAVVVCLVGGGQEINTGEAGISAWLDGVRTLFPGWDVFISPHLTDSEYAASGALDRLRKEKVPAPIFTQDPATPTGAAKMVAGSFSGGTLTTHPALHLSTSMRSFRAEHLSRFVKALLDGEAELGRELFAEFRDHYPIVLTRSMRAARRWIRRQRRGTERAGLVASSSAQRLKPHAIDIRVNIDPVHWFLSPPRDTRSSLYLEDAATEFQVQGLELDWTKSHVGRRPPLAWERLELSQFSRGEVDRREEARAAAVSEERLPRVAHACPAKPLFEPGNSFVSATVT